jgi:hypothetical protein
MHTVILLTPKGLFLISPGFPILGYRKEICACERWQEFNAEYAKGAEYKRFAFIMKKQETVFPITIRGPGLNQIDRNKIILYKTKNILPEKERQAGRRVGNSYCQVPQKAEFLVRSLTNGPRRDDELGGGPVTSAAGALYFYIFK